MTWNEYETWYNDLKIRVPTLGKQITEFPAKTKTLQCWFLDVFGELDLEDCLSVTKFIVCGEQDRPFASDVPSFYRAQARRLRWDREAKDQVPEWKKGQSSNAKEFMARSSGMTAALRKSREIIQQERSAGKSLDEAMAIMRVDRRNEWVTLIG